MNPQPRNCFPLQENRVRAKQTLRCCWLYARFGVLKESDSFGVTLYAANWLVGAITEGKEQLLYLLPACSRLR